MNDNKRAIFIGLLAAAGLWLVATGLVIPSTVTGSRLCIACHASRAAYSSWRNSPHKTVACLKCHGEPGLGGFVSDQLRIGHNILRTFAGDSAGTVVANDACTACHTRIVDDLIVRGKVRIDHRAPQRAGWRCTDCHGSVGHKLQSPANATEPTLDKCFVCHRAGGPAAYRCGGCHINEISLSQAPGAGAGSLDHRRQWRAKHGLADLAACANCHKPSFCKRCHSAAVPHNQGWLLSHGNTIAAKDNKCDDCHKPSFCRDCHGVAMPHPQPYYQKHAKEAGGSARNACQRCHVRGDCSNCHTTHVEHPIIK